MELRNSSLLILLAMPTLVPIVATLAAFADPLSVHWAHLLEVVLPAVLANTVVLVLAVGLGAAGLGTGLAWLLARYRFPGAGLAHIALLLPLAMPGYVLGFVFIAAFDYAGPVQAWWRGIAASNAALWEPRSVLGAACVLIVALYPYVYLIAYQAFRSIGASAVEAAELEGRRGVFQSLALPLARPWITGATLLVVMETLADFGTVALFNVDTFTTAIYQSWFALFALDAALQLAALLILVALLLLAAHRAAQRRGHYVQDPGRPLPRIPLRGWRAGLVSSAVGCFLVLVVVLPLATLMAWSWQHLSQELDPRYLRWLGHSMSLGIAAAVLLSLAALVLASLERGRVGYVSRFAARAAVLGYALPGPLIAVGLFAPLAGLERWLAEWWAPGWVTQGLLLLLLGYWARFFAVAHTPISQQFGRLPPSLTEASRGLGYSGVRLLGRVQAPLLSGTLATAAALVFIDVFKEMPITLMLRPFGWDTLATRVFELTAEGEYQRAALPALSIVGAGLLPVVLLLRGARPSRLGRGALPASPQGAG